MESADIINAVLETDAQITKKIEDARKNKESIIAAAKAEGEELVKKEVEAAAGRLAASAADEKKRADEKIAEISKKKSERLEELDRIFSEKHREWESDLFARVIQNAQTV